MRSAELWQIGSMLLLLSVIAAGFAWFETSRPSARIVATVAALVGFAVVGRLLFAPLPSVKPTTDIVIIAGFALGLAPGWTVGVLTALISNFYFSQGPWTPWQMLAWGVCGLIGALAARFGVGAGSGRASRVPMALICAGAGLTYGLIVNFGSAVNLASGDLSNAFWIQLTTSLPFDLAHAAANFAFFLLIGPLLIAMLERLTLRESLIWPRAAGADGHA